MPTSWVLQVLEARLMAEEGGPKAVVGTKDLLQLSPEERNVVLDALVEPEGDLPVVLVEGKVACVRTYDVDAIVTKVEEAAVRIAEEHSETREA